MFDDDLRKLQNPDRVNYRNGCGLKIGDMDCELNYEFFDDQLFRINIYADIYNTQECDSVILSYLSMKYGSVHWDTSQEYGGIFNNGRVQIYYFQFEVASDQTGEPKQRLNVELVYLPMLQSIRDILLAEQKEIF
jgi:hypothetical protein